ncbi:MAG: hypothetical protein JSS74_10960 [Actinobacteria bacterium]|nr:hypothetical protein [Actinomycetota bacterium]
MGTTTAQYALHGVVVVADEHSVENDEEKISLVFERVGYTNTGETTSWNDVRLPSS